MKNTNDFRANLLQQDLYHTNVDKYVEKIREIDSIVIWGSASTGDLVYNFLEKFGAANKVTFFADNKKEKWGKRHNNLLVLSPEEVVSIVKENPDTKIIIAALHLADINKQLLSLGIEESTIDIRGFGLAKDYWTFQKETPFTIIHSHIDEYEKVYSLLTDERSKSVYLGIINSKISLDNTYLTGIASPAEEQYFDKEIIKLKENEVFCDCGSFTGDTLENFTALSGGKYKKYIAIEADKDSFAELNNKVVENGYRNVDTYNIACWNEKTVLKFQPAQTSGHIADQGEIFVSADALDNILIDDPITFLKMDIEGAEEMALKGARRVITEYKPTLAICLYHSLQDYYKLPLIMNELNKEYTFYIRHYKDLADVETVCYAIPK